MKFLRLLFKKADKPRSFIDVFREYLDKVEKENCLVDRTVRKHRNFFDNISMFLYSKNMREATLAEIRIPFLEELKGWLHRNLVTCSPAHAARHLEMCKRVAKYAVAMEYIDNSPILTVVTGRGPSKEVIYLEENEMSKMETATFASLQYIIVRDLYLFQCYTGLSYGDLWGWEMIQDGQYSFLIGSRTKSSRLKGKREYCVPVDKKASTLINEYQGHLPRITNQQYNRVLKEIAALLNINKNLTTHTARKTFATIKNREGFSLETIADMLGNTPAVASKHYVFRTRDRIKNELERLQSIDNNPNWWGLN